MKALSFFFQLSLHKVSHFSPKERVWVLGSSLLMVMAAQQIHYTHFQAISFSRSKDNRFKLNHSFKTRDTTRLRTKYQLVTQSTLPSLNVLKNIHFPLHKLENIISQRSTQKTLRDFQKHSEIHVFLRFLFCCVCFLYFFVLIRIREPSLMS
jgi:hypothetical protein